jgi:uncharacterized phiE125 gp8 family phage protein
VGHGDIRVSWARTVAPTQEPLSLDEAKTHAKITQDEDDAAVYRFIKSARETCEDYMGRGLLTQTWQLSLSEFADVIYLPMAAPLQSVSTVQYYDVNGALQTLSSSYYVVETSTRPGRIVLAAGQAWPGIQWSRLAARVVITYVVGWTAPTSVPERIKQGLRMYVAYLDCDREGLEPDRDRVLKAAQCCWDDRVQWIDPSSWCDDYSGCL